MCLLHNVPLPTERLTPEGEIRGDLDTKTIGLEGRAGPTTTPIDAQGTAVDRTELKQGLHLLLKQLQSRQSNLLISVVLLGALS